MTDASAIPPGQKPPRRLPIGLLVIGGSVLASAIWWMLTPARERPAPAPPPPVAATAAAPEPAVEKPSPASRPSPAAPREAATEAPAAPAAPLPPAAAPLLRVTADVDGADVFVDRTFVGKAPFETRDITPGRHQVQVSAAGFDGITKGVEVSPDSPTDVAFALKAVVLDAAVDVVHKHRLGSCEGRLTASLAGLRYRAREGDDSFQVPLNRLETFTVNYLEKNLQVKARGGRTWNFTTKAANADPLLVFHRDVEKARKKLAGGT